MTDRDPMPFGKYGPKNGNPKTVGEVKREHPDYVKWLINQDGFKDKNKAMYAYFTDAPEAATAKEVDNIQAEEGLLRGMSESFKTWWKVAYGDRLRKDGEMLYIPYLRVAKEAWLHCEGIFIAAQRNPAPSPAYVPPPPPKPTKPSNEPATEDIAF